MGDIRTSTLPLSKKIRLKRFVNASPLRAYMLALLATSLFVSGCHQSDQPKFRLGSFFGSPMGMTFTDPNNLGNHNVDRGKDEKTGMLYTCKGGFIDLGHLREGIDRTAYLTNITKENLMQGKTEFNFEIIEPSLYWVKIEFPNDWEGKSEDSKSKIIQEVSIYLGQYFAHTSMIWHEIITWYGYSSTGIFPEHISSFSWEDTYSDILGTSLAVEALLTDADNFNPTITKLIDRTMQELDVQPPAVAKHAAEQIKGEWFSGSMYIFVNMKKHNFDVGFSDGYVSPQLVPGICPDVVPTNCPTPDLKVLKRLGMKMQLEIEPRSLEKNRIFREIDMNPKIGRMEPKVHFPKVLTEISKKSQ